MILSLPWPHKDLSQNSRVHWAVRRKLTADYRFACKAMSKAAKGCREFRIEFAPPSKHRRDIQNVIGSFKAGVDGLSDAAGIDDSLFRIHWPVTFLEPVRHGAVYVEVVAKNINGPIAEAIDTERKSR